MSKDSSALLALKNRLSAIVERIDRSSGIIYIDYPLHHNIGDLLINLGTEEFFSANHLNVKHRYNYHDYPKRIPGITETDVLMFHGGGNLGDIYPEHINLLRRLLKEYPDNQVIVLPQTVFFQSDAFRKTCLDEFLKHPRLSIHVRDFKSLELLTGHGLKDVAMMPDMAHQLVGKLKPEPEIGSDTPLYFMRRDEEAGAIPEALKGQAASSIDWEDCVTLGDRIEFGILIRAIRLAHRFSLSTRLYAPWYRLRNRLIHRGVKLISRSNVIYTNRLHAMLLSLLLGRDVVAFDNSYGKLSTYQRTWLQHVPNLTFLRQDAEVEKPANAVASR